MAGMKAIERAMLRLHCKWCKQDRHVTAQEPGNNCAVAFEHVHCAICRSPIALEEERKVVRVDGC